MVYTRLETIIIDGLLHVKETAKIQMVGNYAILGITLSVSQCLMFEDDGTVKDLSIVKSSTEAQEYWGYACSWSHLFM